MVAMHRFSRMALAAALLAAGTSALADVKDGVDAWSRGDYAKAVGIWQKEAGRGDADAQYNLAQAYRLGRGVAPDMAKAEALYAQAAAAGHPLAADNYGLLLFQQGRRAEAMPYLRDAVGRGDPRAEYLLGIAHFNGDLVEKDWVRAYALLTLANGQGLPQAAQAIAQMDGYIPMDQRQAAATLATQLQAEADANRAQQLATADLAQGKPAKPGKDADKDRAKSKDTPLAKAPPAPPPAPAAPVVTAAEAALADVARVTGTESPATAGADYARPQVAVAAPVAKPALAPKPVAVPAPKPAAPAAKPPVAAAPKPVAPATPPAVSNNGPWRVQLGAFSVPGNADQLWKQVGGKGALAGKTKIVLPSGKLTRLLAGGFATQQDAAAACATLKRGGQSCIVTR
jgi:hypothetical protein